MIKLTRKQRELLQREELILETASRLMQTHGYLGLTMDKIAEAIEYSKGTVYQHFTCKEEVLATLCIRTHSSMLDMFERVVNCTAPTRVRMSGLMLAYTLHVYLHPLEFHNFQVIKTTSFKDKLSAEKKQLLMESELRTLGAVASIPREAIAKGDLIIDSRLTPEELTFSFWAMSYGGLLILSGDFPFSSMGIRPHFVLQNTFLMYLDNMNWKPLSSEWDYPKSQREILEKLFAPELALLTTEQYERLMAFTVA
ncbi:TetR/AcrR family transcriptional regulator [Beggiatoa leptomitoformis]|uniref:TetR family transcriptional regulator n=1 Tax=Beggiatoa leptomitoformis TaxID=288004 RepID=A0A2N9YAG8_9GAMM|nr:TetR/AcrR family transcriptional regulator [Beggiatoa leptomitoformis]ALG67150.1 TetR family transcriptional regulator [Beggiatoa leptomitoformis]AUI67450.1 TetR family transcriptional regulator [Beggiatoa leptomitoformis]